MTYPGAVRAELVLTVKIRKLHALAKGRWFAIGIPLHHPRFFATRNKKVYLSHARRQVRVVLKQKHIVDRRRRKSEEWT
jgi:hypothetical protein